MSFSIDFEGIVYSCGSNEYGQLGLGDTIDRNIPIKIENLPPIKYVACGNGYTLFVDFDNIVYSCGNNNSGELGLGDTNDRNIPSKIENLPPIDNLGKPGEITKYYKSARNAI